MKQLTPEQIQQNWVKLREILNNTFSGERLEKLNQMYDYFEDRMCIAPASGKEHFHYAHPGGYVEHILHIVDLSKQIVEMWNQNGATIDFTMEELIFAALHHDLGKVGDLTEDYYIQQDNDWFIKNHGEYYKHNPNLQFMTVTDRALFLLQHFNVVMNEKEYIGLRLTDGMYEEANKNYYVAYIPSRQLKTNIAYVLHQADMLATRIEYDEWKRGEVEIDKKVNKSVEKIKNVNVSKDDVKVEDPVMESKHADLFDELFGDKS